MKLRYLSLIAVVLLAVGLASAAVVSDGSIFDDEFNGTALDTSNWTQYGTTGNVHAFADVASGQLNLESRFTELDKYIGSSTLNFGSATEWAAQIKFLVMSDMVAGATPISITAYGGREAVLIAGLNSSLNSAKDFYVSLVEGSSGDKFTLGWGGFMAPISVVPLSVASTDLLRNTEYDLVIHHRTDNEIDFYLDGSLIATRSAFPGIADRLGIGDFSGGTTVRLKADYVRVGMPVPEPVTLTLLGIGSLMALRRRRRSM